MRLERVAGRRGLREFLAVTELVYPDRARFVPPLHATVRSWARGDVPGVGLYVVRDRSGRPVARTTLHRDPAFDAKLGHPVQLFGLAEFVDHDEVVATLFDGIRAAARAAGVAAVFGPAALLPNQSGGVITSGYADRGFVDSAWNHPYYPAAYESQGFTRRFEAATWICPGLQADTRDAGAVFPFDDRRLVAERLAVRHGSRRRFATQLPILRRMLNASFSQRDYYTEISAEQLRRQTDGLAHLLDESLLLYLERAGDPVAFVLAVPDVSAFVTAAGGNLHPGNQLRLLVRRRHHRREAVLVVKGTVPEAQGRGYMRLLSRELLRGLRRGGYETLRSTFVEHANAASAAQYVAMGGRPLHGCTFYEQAL